MTSGMACHHRLWAAHTIERRLAAHAIIAHGRQIRSNDVRRDMPSPPFDSIHGRTTSGIACHHRLWAAHTIERRRTLHSIIDFGQHTRSNDVGYAITSPPLDNTHSWQRRAWHDITALGLHARSDYVVLGIQSLPLGSTHDRTTSGVA